VHDRIEHRACDRPEADTEQGIAEWIAAAQRQLGARGRAFTPAAVTAPLLVCGEPAPVIVAGVEPGPTGTRAERQGLAHALLAQREQPAQRRQCGIGGHRLAAQR
jgi:hypothetical protein